MTTSQALIWLNGGWKTDKYACIENGKLGIDVDKLFGFQCVDFVIAYSLYIGMPMNSGVTTNAINLWKNPQPGWIKVKTPKAGDVHFMPFSSGGEEFDHTGVVVQVDASGGFYSIDQNWFNYSLAVGSPPAKVYHKNFNTLGFLRVKEEAVNLSKHYAGRAVKSFWGKDITADQLNTYTQVEEATMLKRICDDPQTDAWYAKIEKMKAENAALKADSVVLKPGKYTVN